MTLIFPHGLWTSPLNITAFQHRFNTETDSAPFSLHIQDNIFTYNNMLYSTVLAMSSWIHCITTCASLTVSCLPVATYTLLATYIVLDTKMQVLSLLEACLD